MKRRDLSGMKFGELSVVRYVIKKYGSKRRGKWECRCSCGKTVEVMAGNLLRGTSTSCGCKFLRSKKYNFVDLTGKKFGSLLVLDRSEKFTKTRGALWMCKCDCGREILIPSNSLTSGNTLTCRNRMSHPLGKFVGEIPMVYIHSVRQNAIKRNLNFTVSAEFLWDLFLKQGKACALSGVPLVFVSGRTSWQFRKNITASLDRIDSSKGYDVDNVRWVHKDINRMRWEFDDRTFLEWCRKCVRHNDEAKEGVK